MNFTPLKLLVTVSAGQGAPKNKTDFSEIGTPFIRAGSLEKLLDGYPEENLELVNEKTAKKYRLKLFPKGSVIFAKSGMSATKGRIYKLKKPAYIVNHLAVLTPSDKVISEYLVLALRRYRPSGLIKDFAYPSISQKEIEAHKVPIPEDIDDQIRIAALLSRVEALIATRKENLRLLDEFLKSTFLEMFGDPVRNEKGFDISPLDKFIAHLTSGGRGWAKYYVKAGKRFIRSLDVQMNAIGNDDVVFVDPPENQETERTRVQENDILLTITGSKIGRVAYVPKGFEEAYISQHVAIIRTEGINPLFLSYYLSMPNAGQRIIKKMQYGQAKPGLNLTQIKLFEILTPEIDLQNEFANIVERTEHLKTLYQKSLTGLENLYGALSQKAFKGELDLSRIPLEQEFEPQMDANGRESESGAPIFGHLDQGGMSDPAAREKLLRRIFEEYFNGDPKRSFSFRDFWARVEFNVLDHMDDECPPLGVGDYNQVREWLFDRLKSGQIEQWFNEAKNQMELRTRP